MQQIGDGRMNVKIIEDRDSIFLVIQSGGFLSAYTSPKINPQGFTPLPKQITSEGKSSMITISLRLQFHAHSSYLMNSFIFIHKLDFRRQDFSLQDEL